MDGAEDRVGFLRLRRYESHYEVKLLALDGWEISHCRVGTPATRRTNKTA
jgi:hypothetical protein